MLVGVSMEFYIPGHRLQQQQRQAHRGARGACGASPPSYSPPHRSQEIPFPSDCLRWMGFHRVGGGDGGAAPPLEKV